MTIVTIDCPKLKYARSSSFWRANKKKLKRNIEAPNLYDVLEAELRPNYKFNGFPYINISGLRTRIYASDDNLIYSQTVRPLRKQQTP